MPGRVRANSLRQPNMTMKYAKGPLMKMRIQNGKVPMIQMRVLKVVPRVSANHPLSGLAEDGER